MTTTTTVTFKSGATRELHPTLVARVVGLTAEGRVVVDDGFGYLFGLTFCCNAYDKGMENGSGCRACYGEDAGQYFAEVADPVVKTVTLTPAAIALLSDVLDINDDDDELAENSGATVATITELRAAVAAALEGSAS